MSLEQGARSVVLFMIEGATMKTLLTLVVAAAAAFTAGGCVVYPSTVADHVHSDYCGHYYYRGGWYQSNGHHHGPNCGHRHQGGNWVLADDDARRDNRGVSEYRKPPPPPAPAAPLTAYRKHEKQPDPSPMVKKPVEPRRLPAPVERKGSLRNSPTGKGKR